MNIKGIWITSHFVALSTVINDDGMYNTSYTKCICIGYTLGSQCILGLYPRWLLIMPKGGAGGRYQQPPVGYHSIHSYPGYKQFVG